MDFLSNSDRMNDSNSFASIHVNVNILGGRNANFQATAPPSGLM